MTDAAALSPLIGPGLGKHIAHGFFGRTGGVSTGLYRGLNCGFGSGDERETVAENRARVAGAMTIAPDHLLTIYQTHSPYVLTVTGLHTSEDAPKADAMVTSLTNVSLAILTADCAPVLFSDERARVIGAAHAGWKGAFAGVLENTISAMEALGANRTSIKAIIGPTISQASYEVGPEFKTRFVASDRANERFFAASAKPNHFLFDLPGYCVARLTSAGIESTADLGECTYADEGRFFSYRRTTHRGEPDYGRNISVVVLRP